MAEMRRELASALGLCRKAGKLLLGFDAVADAVKRDKACLLLMAKDLSPKSAGEIYRLAHNKNIKVAAIQATMDDLWHTLGKRAGILAVTDKNLAVLTAAALNRDEEDIN